MADYTNSQIDTRGQYPENAIDAKEWSAFEPLLTVQQLKDRFLKGVPLVSFLINPLTGKPDKITDEDLKDYIIGAVADIQMETKVDIFPVKRSEKKPFDRQAMIDLGYMRSNYRPILSIDKLSVAPGNTADILTITPEWLAKDGWVRGEIRIIPTVGSLSSGYIPASDGIGNGSAFVAIMGGRAWVPSFWTLEYTTGFDQGNLPRTLNKLIGCYAAINTLSMLQNTNRSNSHSLGMDGQSQSSSSAGPEIYAPRIKQLEAEKAKMLKLYRAMFGNRFSIGEI